MESAALPFAQHGVPAGFPSCLLTLKQAPPLPIGLTPYRAFDLHPVPARAGAIGGAAFLRHDAFEPKPDGGFQKRVPVLEALKIADVGAIRPGQQVGQICLALFERQHPQVALPDAQQIESPKCVQIVAMRPLKRLEVRKALVIEGGDLSIKDDVADRQAGHRANQIWEAKAKIVSTLRIETDGPIASVKLASPAIKLDLMKPAQAVRRFVSLGWNTGLDKGEAAQHARLVPDGMSTGKVFKSSAILFSCPHLPPTTWARCAIWPAA